MISSLKTKLFPYLSRLPEKPDRLIFCFHHAGGSASVYYRYMKNPDNIGIIPVELPGHGSRIDESFSTDWHELVSSICSDILTVLKEYDIPFTLLGCSLGSLIAFECALKLKEYDIEPDSLIICSHSSPDVVSPGYKTSMGSDRLMEEIELLSGTSQSIIGNKEMMSFYLPIIYKDYLLHDMYKYSGNTLKKTDISVNCGTDDPYFDRDNMKNWLKMSDGDNSYSEFEGGHFFLYDDDKFYRVINEMV